MVSTIVSHSDMDPSPRADLFIDTFDLDGSTVTITVWQTSSAGSFRVRNAIRRTSAGGFLVTDYEIPLGVEVTYRVEQFNGAGVSTGFAALSLLTTVNVGVGFAVLSDPLNPRHAVLVSASPQFGGQVKRVRPVSTYRAGVNTVALMGLEGLLTDLPLACETESLADADMLELVLAETQFLVRVQTGMARIPPILHVVSGEPVQKPVTVQWEGELISWEITADQVSRTEIDIIVPVLTWQAVIDFYPTWTALLAANATWLDVFRNTPEA